jgi:hypothetical protein
MPRIWHANSTHSSGPTNSLWFFYDLAIRSILDVRDKRRLTEELIQLLPEEQQISFDTAFPAWWFNLRRNGGMRLTALGYQIFVEDLDLEHYEYPIDNPMLFNQQTILDLDRKMQMPYYIHATKGVPKKIVFFGSREAVMANLYGNLQQFLDNYQP